MKPHRCSSFALAFVFVAGTAHGAHARGAICGDLDGSGAVTVTDAVQAQRIAAGLDQNLIPSRCNNLGATQCGDVDQTGAVTVTDAVLIQRAAAGLSSPCSVEGWGSASNPMTARPYFSVTSTADSGSGTLRAALTSAASAGGGRIVFDLPAGHKTITLSGASGLTVPANTIIDGIGQAWITIQAGNVLNNGALNIHNSNVAVRHLRIRNAGNDAIQIAPKNGSSLIRDIAVQRVTITKARDGAIDVTGCVGLTPPPSGCNNGQVSNVTMAENYLAGSGSAAGGGANLTKYGANSVSMYGNFWDKNLRRNPDVDNTTSTSLTSIVDVRYNLVRTPHESWTKVVGTNARANYVSNFFEGSSMTNIIISLQSGGAAYASGNSIPPGTTLSNGSLSGSQFGSPPSVPSSTRNTVFNSAGAAPRNSTDTCFLNAANYTATQSCP